MTAKKATYGSWHIICDTCGAKYFRHGIGGELSITELRTLAREARGWNTAFNMSEHDNDFCSRACTVDYPENFPIDRPPGTAATILKDQPERPSGRIPRFK